MKSNIFKTLLYLSPLLILTSCSNPQYSTQPKQSQPPTTIANGEPAPNQPIPQQSPIDIPLTSYSQIDYDLSEMSSEMSYATLTQINQQPDDYIDKVLKVKGQLQRYIMSDTDTIIYTLINVDNMKCCQQGVELDLPDSDDYPLDGETVIAVGMFDTYIDDADDMRYCALRDAEIITQ